MCVFCVFFFNLIQICYSCSNHPQDNSLYLQQHIGTENKREKKFIFLKEGPTDITVQTVRKVVRQVSQALLQDLGLIAETRHIQRVVLHRPTVVRKTKTLGFLKAVLLVKIVGCCCCMLLIWHLFMQKETSRSFRKIVDFVPILKHFQGQIIFFYICYMVKKQNFQTKICVLVNLQNLTLTSIS